VIGGAILPDAHVENDVVDLKRTVRKPAPQVIAAIVASIIITLLLAGPFLLNAL